MANNRHRMCTRKVSFSNKAQAQRVADRFDQTIYECPVCYCYHTTSKHDWREELDDWILAKAHKMVNELLRKKNEELKQRGLRIAELEKENHQLRKLIKNT